MIKAKNLFPILFFLFLDFLVFRNFFLKGLHPYPGNFLLAWFEPFKSDYFINGVITIAHKPLSSDLFRQSYPFKLLASDMIREDLLPLWNPYNGAGMPFLATLNIGLLDPSNIAYLILSPPFAWSGLITLHYFLIGLFTYLYCRKIKLRNLASIGGAVIFLFSGFVTERVNHGTFGVTLLSLPLVPYLIEDYLQNEKSKKIFILPFVIFINIVSGPPQISLYALIFWFLYAVFRLIQTKEGFKKGFLPGILFVLGLGIASFQLLPTFELFKYANISRESSEFIFRSYLVPFKHLLGLPIPNFFGSDATYNFFGSGDTIESVVYMGLIPLFLALFAIIDQTKNKKPDLRLFYLGGAIISILLTLNWILPKFLYSFSVPIISTGIPSRIFMITTFCLSILAGIGFDKLVQKTEGRRIKSLIIVFSLFIFFLLAYTVLPQFDFHCPERLKDCKVVSFRNTMLEAIGFFLFILSIVFVSKFKIKTGNLSIFVILIVTTLGLYNTNKFLPFSSVSSFHPKNNLINAIKEKTTDARVFGIGEANISTDLPTLFRFYNPDYYHPLYIKRYGELISFANSGRTNIILPRSDIDIIRDLNIPQDQLERRQRLFSFLSVRYLIFKKSEVNRPNNIIWEDDKWYLVENPALPRAYAVGSYQTIKDRESILKKMFEKDFNESSTVILEENLPEKINNSTSIGDIKLLKDKGNSVEIQTKTSEDSILVLTDNYYPGWLAFIDGKQTKIYRANYTLRGIVLPKGKHKVEFRYQPESFTRGMKISLISLTIVIGIFVFNLYLARNKP